MSGPDYLLDTNIVIGRLKTSPEVMALVDQLGFDFGNTAVSQITRIELLSFSRMGRDEERQLHAFLDDCLVVPLDEAIERATIKIRRAHTVKLPDAIIAATALVKNLQLLTMDRRLGRIMSGAASF